MPSRDDGDEAKEKGGGLSVHFWEFVIVTLVQGVEVAGKISRCVTLYS